MSEDSVNKTEGMSSEQNESREGYRPVDGYSRDYRTPGRTPRPRIRTTHPVEAQSEESDEGGFRPDGFGAGLQGDGSQRPYRPRTQQGGYQPRQQGGYQP
ncbi:MAG: pseudouridine synthase, partial [Prevotellaceae bacterium]|nr:pseudouridine synthase [Prevotellaceae bacterium]